MSALSALALLPALFRWWGVGSVPVAALVGPQGYGDGAVGQRWYARREVLLLGLLLVAVLGEVAVEAGRRRRHVAVLGGRDDAAQRAPVEDEHGRAALQPRVAALALPVAVAGLAQGHVAVCVVVAESWGQEFKQLLFTIRNHF